MCDGILRVCIACSDFVTDKTSTSESWTKSDVKIEAFEREEQNSSETKEKYLWRSKKKSNQLLRYCH